MCASLPRQLARRLPAGELRGAAGVSRPRAARAASLEMLAGLLISAMALAASPAVAERPTVAVVITAREGLTQDEALDLAWKLTRALRAAGALVPMDPQATRDRLGSKDPAACGSRSVCLAGLAHELRVSA